MKNLVVCSTLLAFSGLAAAQSSVTVFGIVDEAVRYVKNGDVNLKSVASGGLNTSRLGFRGIEDLGSGLKAGFWMETGLNVDSGTQSDATRFWNRRTTVSLISNAGELRLGRDFTPTYLGYSDYDPFGDNGVAGSGKFDSSLGTARDTGTRADNQVAYLAPGNLGGLYARVSIAPGEGAVGKKYAGGRLGFSSGPFDVSANYGQTTVAPLLGEDSFKVAGVGGSYDARVVKILAWYQQNEFSSQKLARYSLGAVAPIGPGQLKVVWIHADASGRNAASVSVESNDADQFALGYVYNLSNRTAIFGTAAHVKNKGAATFAVASAPALVAGGKSTGAEIGIRHSF